MKEKGFHHGEAGSVVVHPPHCGPLSPGSIPGAGVVCPFGFQSKLASPGFFPRYSGFPPASKTGLLSFISFYSYRGSFLKAVLVH